MRKRILVGLFLILSYVSPAQTPSADSLQLVLQQTKTDTARLQLLNAIAEQIYQVDFPKTIEIATEELTLAKKIGDEKYEMRGHYFLGVAHLLSSSEEASIHHVEKALEIAEKLPNGQKDQMDCQNLLGNIYHKLNNVEKALQHFFESVRIAGEYDNPGRLASSYSNIGEIYKENGEFDKAKSYYLDALDIFLSEQDLFYAAFIYNNLSELVASPDSSILLLDKAIAIFEQKHYMDGIAHAGINLAENYTKLGKFQKAIPYLERAREIFESEAHNYKPGLVKVYLRFGTVKGELGNMTEAKGWFEKSIKLAKEIDHKHYLKDAYEEYSSLMENNNMFSEALHYYKLADIVKDSLFNESKARELADSETRYQTKLKEKDIAQKELELEIQSRQKNRIILGGIIFVLVLSGIFFSLRSRQKLKRQKAEHDLLLEKAEAEKLRELNTMKSTFFANISHEFRTPLTLILGPMKQIREGRFKGNIQKYQGIMIRNAERLLKLVNQLLDLSKLESGKMEMQPGKADIVKTVRAMAFSFESLAERQEINFEVIVPDGCIMAFFDKDKLEKILINLLSNAFKFTSEKGNVSIELEIIENAESNSENVAVIRVNDTGIGISPDELPHIFERFFQSSNTSSLQVGSGIGLALTKELVELHRGKIQVQSNCNEVDKGTLFVLHIPIGKAISQNSTIQTEKKIIVKVAEDFALELIQDEVSKAGVSAPLLLLVEDNYDVRLYIKNQLEHDFRIIEAINGKVGLERAIETIPDLIISDVMMPELDGMNMCKRLKNNDKTSHIPIIMLTAKVEREDKIEGIEIGADDYLMKPFDARELKARIQNLIEQRRRLRKSFGRDFAFFPESVAAGSIDAKFLVKVKSSIEENLNDETFSVVDLGKMAGMSRSQLHRKLKALTNQSPNQIIRGMRLLRAKELLEKKAGNVSEVAFMVGFDSLAYFSKCYRDHFNVSPSEVYL